MPVHEVAIGKDAHRVGVISSCSRRHWMLSPLRLMPIVGWVGASQLFHDLLLGVLTEWMRLSLGMIVQDAFVATGICAY